VEDDDSVAAMVLEMLDQLGHSGMRVATVASALAVLSGVDEFDLVFSDVLLPGGGSGLDLAREMGRRRMAVPVILTSGFGGGVTQRLAAANLPFLRKPYRIDALRQAIEAALRSPGALPQDPVSPA
jgi:DNA-binding NtrC family response regulator